MWNHRCSWGINVRDFVGNPCPRISIPTDKYTYKHFLNMYQVIRTCNQRNYVHTNKENFGYPRTLTPINTNDTTVKTIIM